MNIVLELSPKEIEVISRCIHLAVVMGDESHKDRVLLKAMDNFFTEVETLGLEIVNKVS